MSYVIKHTLFLKWWLFITIIAVGFIFAAFLKDVCVVWI